MNPCPYCLQYKLPKYISRQARRKQLQIGGAHIKQLQIGGAHIIFFKMTDLCNGGGGHICANYWEGTAPPCPPLFLRPRQKRWQTTKDGLAREGLKCN